MSRLCCPYCQSTVLSGAAPDWICMDCDCQFTIVHRGEREIDRISMVPLPPEPLF